jgi:2-oxoglutarate ferredoxin oxidoreductase subunit alpha
MHRVGGIEKEDGSGNISYDPINHEAMVRTRAAKIAGIADDIPLASVEGDEDAELCILGWGSTWGAINAGVRRARAGGRKVAWIHLTHLNPLHRNLGELLRRYPRILVPELNTGQLCRLVRGEFLVDARPLSKMQGAPFTGAEIFAAIEGELS